MEDVAWPHGTDTDSQLDAHVGAHERMGMAEKLVSLLAVVVPFAGLVSSITLLMLDWVVGYDDGARSTVGKRKPARHLLAAAGSAGARSHRVAQ